MLSNGIFFLFIRKIKLFIFLGIVVVIFTVSPSIIIVSSLLISVNICAFVCLLSLISCSNTCCAHQGRSRQCANAIFMNNGYIKFCIYVYLLKCSIKTIFVSYCIFYCYLILWIESREICFIGMLLSFLFELCFCRYLMCIFKIIQQRRFLFFHDFR